eukprot:Hpha_TRINITY_DN13741_c0_g1::TRINITY_DN13741_c0_g1_i1::g.142755::m.142755
MAINQVAFQHDWHAGKPLWSSQSRLAFRLCMMITQNARCSTLPCEMPEELVHEICQWLERRQGQWTHVHVASSCTPAGRSGLAMLQQGRSLFVFGGHVHSDESKVECMNDFWEFDLVTKRWLEWGAEPGAGPESCPEPTFGHAMARLRDDMLVVYGGQKADTATVGQVWALPLTSSKRTYWRKLASVEDGPGARWGHSLTTFVDDERGESVLMFGGAHKRRTFNCTWSLTSAGWHRVHTQGIPPAARRRHVAVNLQDRHLLIMGGRSPKVYMNDVHVLSIGGQSQTWRQVRGTDPPSLTRSLVCSTPHCPDNQYKWMPPSGDVTPAPPYTEPHVGRTDKSRHRTSRALTHGDHDGYDKTIPVLPRTGHVGACIGGRVYIGSGFQAEGPKKYVLHSDMHEWDLKTNTWAVLTQGSPSAAAPGQCSMAALSVVDGCLLFFGGRDRIMTREVFSACPLPERDFELLKPTHDVNGERLPPLV